MLNSGLRKCQTKVSDYGVKSTHADKNHKVLTLNFFLNPLPYCALKKNLRNILLNRVMSKLLSIWVQLTEFKFNGGSLNLTLR